MAGQQFSLKWHSHSLHLANSFNVLRSEEDFLTDVTLCCEGKKIKGHKIIFSVCSTYFRETFMENPCKHPVVIFKNVKFDDLANIVEFMYKGEVSISQDSLSSFLHVAEMLQVRGLSESQELIPEKSIISTPVSTQSESLFISVPEGNKIMLAAPQNIGTTQHQTSDNLIKSSPLKIQQQIQQIKTTHFVDQSGVPAKRKRFTLRETRNAKVSTSNTISTNVNNNQQQFVTETLDSSFTKQEPAQQTVIVDENGKESIYEEVEYLTMKSGSGIPEYVVSGIDNTEQSQDNMEEMTLMQETFEIIEDGKQGMSDDAGNETGTGDEQNEIITQIDSEGNKTDDPNKSGGGDDAGTSKWTQCQYCKLVITSVNLWRHVRTQHTSQPPRKCDYCKKTFKNKYSLREHVRISHESKQSVKLSDSEESPATSTTTTTTQQEPQTTKVIYLEKLT